MEISLWLLLFCWSAVLPKTLSQPLTTYLVTAPTSLRLDAVETVLVQLFGFTQPVELYVILKSTQGSQSVKYSEERLTLNQANNYQAAAKVQVLPKDLVEGASNVVLLVQGSGINDQRVIDISRSNGFMFIQTDKSLYTPEQSVKVRVYSLNEELRPANRKVILTFKDPEGQKVDISELIDNNNGIPSMQNPFKIPLNPKLGVWSIEATYSKDFDTQAIAVFQVKEYVLPSISITVKPEENFISSDNYRRFAFQISASYVNGVPVRKGVVFIRYGFISNKGEPVIFPNSLTRKLLSPLGVVDVNQDIKALLAGTARYTLESLIKKYLYITVLVQEEQGGISEETEYTAVKFVRSPYSLHLITTPRFVKPGLPYNIKVLVRDPTGQPVAGVPVNIVDKCIVRGSPTSCYCTGSEESQSDGFIERICNIPPHTAMAVLTYVTAAPARSAEGQASFILEAPAYNSPQSRYLYIHHPQRGSLVIGHHVHIRVSAATARNVPSFNVNYMVLSKGKVVTFGVVEGSGVSGQNQFVRFRVTPEMTPSIRLLVYYLIEREVVADSLWIEVEGKCVNSLKTEVRYRRRDQRPKSHLLLDVSTKQDGLVALSAVDTAIFPLRRNHKDPVDMVLRHIELSDQGCGAGGGGDAQGVFQLAGLTLLTNAIHQGSQSAGTCTEAVRAKRSLTEKEQKAVMGRKLPGSIREKRSLTEEQKMAMVAGHGNVGRCCRRGLDHIPSRVTCEQFAIQSVGEGYPRCRKAFQDCCERLVKSLPEDLHYSGRDIGQDEFFHLAAPPQPAPVPRAKRSLTKAQENELVAGHGNVGKCCRRGLGYIPNSVTCEQFAIHSIRQAFPSCRKAFQDCCERSLAHITGDFQYSRPGIRPGLVRAKRSLTEAQKNELVAGHGNVGRCCRRGLGYLPSSVTCEQFAIQSIRKTYPRCRKAFQDCCERSLESLPEYLQYSRDMGSDLDMAPSVRSYFPESWLWEVQPVRDHLLSVNMSLPDSLTTWQITAVGMFQNGICVQDPVQVSVSLPVSVNIPLPYQLVRGEQLDLLGSVYNENIEPIQYCVTLTVGPEFCLLHSQSDGDSGLRTTACVWTHLSGSGVGKGGPFTLLGLKPGEHTLIFTLRTRDRPGAPRDIVKKKLRVVPEGVRKETSSVGTLDPQGIYGSEKIKVLLKNRPPPDLVPDSSVERSLSFNGVIMGKMLSVILEPEGLGKLIRRPLGSAEAGLDGLLPLIHVYRYLEWNDRWNVLGEDVRANIFNLKTRIKEGVVNMLSFRVKDNPSSYSLWMKGKPSTRLTAKVVHTLALLKDVIKVDYTSVGLSVDWLINAQNGDGSFRELALDSKRVTADPEEHSVYLTSFVLISLKRATQIKHSALQQQSQRDAMTQAVLYISQHVMDVKSLYVRAVATYALTYHNIDNEMATTLFENLEGLARQKVGTMELRYWQESNVAEWQQPDQSSGLMVATTAYVMLTSVFKGRLYYVKPIVNWLTQDQHYGGGFYSTEDMVLTLEAITEYSLKLTRSELNQDIVVSGKDIKALVKLRENLPMVPPVQVHTYGDITVSTGYGNGVSHVELKTVYYQTTVSLKECNFDFNIELTKKSTRTRYHSLTACVKYRPPPNEVEPESGLTVLEIHLPTGVQPNLNELEPFKNGDIPAILSYKMRGNVVIIEMEYVPSDIFRCIGFRVRAEFNVVAAAKSIFRVFESEVQGSVCEKQFSFAEEDLQRLCFGKECQCMKAACATYRGNSTALTAEERILETCYDHIQYAYKVKIKSAVAEGDFMTYTAIVVLVLKQKDQAFEGVRPGVEVALVKKATCSWVELHKDAHFIVQGSRGSELLSYDNVRYRFPLDLDAVLELLPDCGPTGCMDSELNQYEEDLQIFGCG
ncbi:complement C5 isoform X26 [Gadus morhua]|uniref:complement C5 isoform X26 n=1 Tax=Gadus morhua TaxID=8049 RepID=UPI0011B72075|nr:complement C5 isoform X26 [Gadus morhua]